MVNILLILMLFIGNVLTFIGICFGISGLVQKSEVNTLRFYLFGIAGQSVVLVAQLIRLFR